MEFLAFLQLRLFLAMGWHMQALVVSWYVYALTHDPLMLAMVGLAEAVPAIGLALPSGYFVDRMDKRKGIRIAVFMIITSAIVSAVLVQPWVAAEYGVGPVITGLLVMIMINGSARAIYSPSMFSALGQIVPRDEIARASAMSSSVWQGAMIAGPLLGGLIYGLYGVGVAAIVYVGLMVLGGTGSLRLTPKPPVEQTERRSMKQDLTLGIRFIFSRPVILGALSLDLFAVLFGGVVALLPVFAHDILHVGESGLGLLRAAMSIGSVSMMAFLSWKPIGKNAGRYMLWSVAGFGACMLAFSASTMFALSVAILIIAGSFDAVSVVVRHTILQLETPEDMKGRVAAANTMFISSSNELGAVESGIAAKLFGTVPSVVIGGMMTLLVVAIVAWKNPKLRRMDMTS
ncbi:MAG TPA: MFS transporter [Candidatus Didemnitutus sp.]|nr:MFS transporter [Candidatus Didemnitutus sp.]